MAFSLRIDYDSFLFYLKAYKNIPIETRFVFDLEKHFVQQGDSSKDRALKEALSEYQDMISDPEYIKESGLSEEDLDFLKKRFTLENFQKSDPYFQLHESGDSNDPLGISRFEIFLTQETNILFEYLEALIEKYQTSDLLRRFLQIFIVNNKVRQSTIKLNLERENLNQESSTIEDLFKLHAKKVIEIYESLNYLLEVAIETQPILNENNQILNDDIKTTPKLETKKISVTQICLKHFYDRRVFENTMKDGYEKLGKKYGRSSSSIKNKYEIISSKSNRVNNFTKHRLDDFKIVISELKKDNTGIDSCINEYEEFKRGYMKKYPDSLPSIFTI